MTRPPVSRAAPSSAGAGPRRWTARRCRRRGSRPRCSGAGACVAWRRLIGWPSSLRRAAPAPEDRRAPSVGGSGGPTSAALGRSAAAAELRAARNRDQHLLEATRVGLGRDLGVEKEPAVLARDFASRDRPAGPFGNTPSRPDATTRSPTCTSSLRFTYLSVVPCSSRPGRMPRTRVRWISTSMPLLGSVSSSTREACGLVLEITPTTPSGAITGMPVRMPSISPLLSVRLWNHTLASRAVTEAATALVGSSRSSAQEPLQAPGS